MEGDLALRILAYSTQAPQQNSEICISERSQIKNLPARTTVFKQKNEGTTSKSEIHCSYFPNAFLYAILEYQQNNC